MTLTFCAGGQPWWRFAALNFIGAVTWAILVTGIGFLPGHVAQIILTGLRPYAAWIVAAPLAFFFIRFARR